MHAADAARPFTLPHTWPRDGSMGQAEPHRAVQGVAATQREPVEPGRLFDQEVLVVEDNGIHRRVIDQIRMGLGCRPHLSTGTMEGLRAPCKKRFDLILLDIRMAGVDCIKSWPCFQREAGKRWVSAAPPDAPLVGAPAHALAENSTRLPGWGPDDDLCQPVGRGPWHAMLNRPIHPVVAGAPTVSPSDAGVGGAAPVVEVLDSAALDRLRELDPKGENHLLQRVLTAFQTSIARLVPQVLAASAAGDLGGVRHVAHTLKSSSASIGAMKLAQMCGDIESMIRLDKVDALSPRVDAMCAEIETVLQALKHLLDNTK
jgi:HPt (histidine-containing phosphotransfer) domain-containing protein